MIVWSPSSWNLYKQCPAKYKIMKVDRWVKPRKNEDNTYARLAIPGLVVDKLIELWIYREEYDNLEWFDDNFEMIWSMFADHKIKTNWMPQELESTRSETLAGLDNAIRMLRELKLEEYSICPQPNFFESITEKVSITGSADLLLAHNVSEEVLLIDLKNAHSRNGRSVTKDQLLIYQIGLQKLLGISVDRAGFLFFNPRVNDWKWFKLSATREQQIIEKLEEATRCVEEEYFPEKWSSFGCEKFCPVRMSCSMYRSMTGLEVK